MAEESDPYSATWIHQRARLIALAIDARQQRYPDEPRFYCHPLSDEVEENRWNDANHRAVLSDYEVNDLGI